MGDYTPEGMIARQTEEGNIRITFKSILAMMCVAQHMGKVEGLRYPTKDEIRDRQKAVAVYESDWENVYSTAKAVKERLLKHGFGFEGEALIPEYKDVPLNFYSGQAGRTL